MVTMDHGDGDELRESESDNNVDDVDFNTAKKVHRELVEHSHHDVLLTLLSAKRTFSFQMPYREADWEASGVCVQQFGAAATTTYLRSIERVIIIIMLRRKDYRQRQIILRNWFANYIRLRRGGG